MIATSALISIANAQTIKAPEGDIKSASCPVKLTNSIVKSSQISLSDNPTTDQIKQLIADLSQKYGLDYDQLSSVIECESQFKLSDYGDSGLAFGIAQFHKPTFKQYCAGNYYDTYDQLDCMARMFSIGQARHWSCFKKLYTEVIHNDHVYNQLYMAKN